jgi:hypothetical protein
MRIKAVETSGDIRQFHQLPHLIYKNDNNWICHLEQDIEDVFDRNQNPYFKQGNAQRWILHNDSGLVIGRVAAFYNERYFNQSGKRVGGMGFFECTNDYAAAKLLFDTCADWLKKQNVSAMDGPINFGEKDRFWGLMVSGFKNPSYLENYNPTYYQTFFEKYGFVKTVEQSTSEITRADFNYERFNRIASRVLKNPAYRFEHYRDAEMERFANDFVNIYNQAWSHRTDFTPMTLERVRTTLKSLRPILMEDIIWFVYAHNEPAGFYINTIDVNQIFKHLKGKMNWWGKLKFLWHRRFGNINRVRGIVFGVIPKYQNLGLEAGMIMKFHESMSKKPNMVASELAWIGDFNPKMHSLFDALGAKTTKIHYTYRYHFES